MVLFHQKSEQTVSFQQPAISFQLKTNSGFVSLFS